MYEVIFVLEKITKIEDVKVLSLDELKILSKEVNEFILKNVSITGGHLGSNLGATDLTIALLKVFDFNKDKIIFDVGHQAYAYKILSGRKEKFNVLRKHNGPVPEVGTLLDKEGIAVRAGHHCAQPALRALGYEMSVRPTFALYNTREDVDKLVIAVKKIIGR